MVLLAESFPPSVTATAVWLNERGVDLTLMRYQAYKTGERRSLTGARNVDLATRSVFSDPSTCTSTRDVPVSSAGANLSSS